MKKFWWLFLLFFISVKSFASVQDPTVIQEKTYVIHFSTTVPANTTSIFDLISLSTTSTIYPHTNMSPKDVGELDVSHITMLFDKVAAASTTVKIGVVTAINPSTGSATYFFSRSSLNNVSNTDVLSHLNFSPAFYRAKVIPQGTSFDGKTPYLISNETDVASFVINSTQTFQSTNGTMLLRTGDIIMKAVTFGSAVNYIVDLWYHAEP